jgi:Ca2+-transporting ATPase
MGPREWVISLALGCIPLPLGALIRLIPNEPCERAFEKLQLLPIPELLPISRPDVEPGSSFGTDHVRNNSGSSAELRRGSVHVHGSSQVRKRHCAFPDPDAARHA